MEGGDRPGIRQLAPGRKCPPRRAWPPRSRSRRRRSVPNELRPLRPERVPAPSQLPEFRLLDYQEQLITATELLKGGDPRRCSPLSTITAAGPTPINPLTVSLDASPGLLVDEEGLIPAAPRALRGPELLRCSPCLARRAQGGGVVVATMPLLRPGEIATVIDRAEGQPRHRRQPLHRRLPAVERTRHSSIVKYMTTMARARLKKRCARSSKRLRRWTPRRPRADRLHQRPRPASRRAACTTATASSPCDTFREYR